MAQRRYQPVDLSGLKTYSIADRRHRVETGRLAKTPPPGASAAQLLDALPDYLGARQFRAVVEAVVRARRADRPVVLALGAHVVKVGCGPIIRDLIERKVITALAMNGATAIHDVELAIHGGTSEEVADTIRDGTFGMVRETLGFFAGVCDEAHQSGVGFGEAVGRRLAQANAPYIDASIIAAAMKAKLPITVHVALGTDTVHVGPALDAAKLGAATMHDFRLLCDVVADLGADSAGGPGGVWLNVGSAVVLPEIFLKAVSVARNLGADLDAMITANFDMLRHYRPKANVVTRPVSDGHGFEVIGQHEILLPLLRQAIIEQL